MNWNSNPSTFHILEPSVSTSLSYLLEPSTLQLADHLTGAYRPKRTQPDV